MSEGSMQQDHNCYSFSLTDHVKQDRPDNVLGTLHLFKYLVPELCVYVTLQYYLVVTSKLRTSLKLLISYIKPYNAVTSSTIGRWIKLLLQQVGINTQTFLAHSTRNASVSKAVVSASADVILNTAGCSSESTFRKYYKKPV